MKPVWITLGAATACGNSGARRENTDPMRRPGNDAICSQRFFTIGRIRVGPSRQQEIRIVVHLGDIDIRAAAGFVQRAAHHQRTAGVALDQQDDLPVAQQRRKRTRHHRLRIAAGHHDDDIRAIHRGGKFGRRAFDRGKAAGFHIDAAMRTDLGKPRVVEIVQPQPMPGQAQLGHEIDAADPRADDRDRAHAITPDWRSVPSVSLS